MSPQNSIPVVGIVGGGFTGAAVALHLADALGPDTAARIIVFEPRERLGAGLAYDTAEPVHRINVPAGRMSLHLDDPEHFSRWLAETGALADDPEALTANGLAFPRRAEFGRYASAQLAPLLASGRVEHRRTRVTDIVPKGEGWSVRTQDRHETEVDILVLAVSHPSPALPRALKHLAGQPKLIADATKPDALSPIDSEDRVLVIGNGLTSADVIAALRRRGHRGPITAISRRGLRSRGHPKAPQEPYGDFLASPAPTASRLLHRARLEIAAAARAGLSWHAVLDTLRSQAQAIWAGLPIAERRRIVRHLRPFWDVHRFRIAPQVEQALDEAVAEGSLSILAASVVAIGHSEDGFHVDLRKRHDTEPVAFDVDAVVVTTGPGHGGILQSQPFLSALAERGLLTLCPTGLGILNDADARAVTTAGDRLDTLLIAGPLARGTVGELMGLPQVTEHAVLVAGEVANALSAATIRQTSPVRGRA